MGVNHVNLSNGESIIDLRKDTISPDVVLKGYTGHDKAGNPFTGTYENKIPDGYINTSGATAGAYDIYNGKTAYVNGQLVTGAYVNTPGPGGTQYNSSVTNCSTSQFVIPCNFAPTVVCIILVAGTYNTNTVISAMFWAKAAIYHSRTSSGVTRTSYTSSISNYWSYDPTNKRVTVKRPTTSYNWSSQNYRVFCFK